MLVLPLGTSWRAASPARLSQQPLPPAGRAPSRGAPGGTALTRRRRGTSHHPLPPCLLVLHPSSSPPLSPGPVPALRSLPGLCGESRPQRKRRGGGGSRGFAGGRGGARALLHGEAGEEQAPEEGTRELTQRSGAACFPGSTASLPGPAEGRYRHRHRRPRGLGPAFPGQPGDGAGQRLPALGSPCWSGRKSPLGPAGRAENRGGGRRWPGPARQVRSGFGPGPRSLPPSVPPCRPRSGRGGGRWAPLSLERTRAARRAFSCRPGSEGPLLLGLLRRWECGLDGTINFPLEFSFLLPLKGFSGPSRCPAQLFVGARNPAHEWERWPPREVPTAREECQ